LQTGDATITVTSLPVATFNYAGTPYCSNGTNPTPTMLEGGAQGTFTASSGSLKFVSETTGEIDLSTSTAGTYTVTNTITGTGGCSTVTATADITITKLPIATFSYMGTPYCQSSSNPAPTFSGGGTAGTFTSTAGLLFISALTGEIDIANSTPGTYTVTNTIAAASGCELVSATSSVTITPAPVQPVISYAGTPFCSSDANPQAVTQAGTTGGVYSYTGTGTLVLNTTTGDITPNGSTVGTYTVTYTIAATGGCAQLTTSTSIVIEAAPTAVISYASTTYCNSASPVTPTLTGTTGGSYSATPDGGRMIIGNGLIIDETTGVITPTGSNPETYNVYYQVYGCALVTATTQVTILAITAAPVISTITTEATTVVTGTSSEANGTSIEVFNGSTSLGTTTVSSGAWTKTIITPASGDVITAKATTSGKCVSVASNEATIPAAPTGSSTQTFCGN